MRAEEGVEPVAQRDALSARIGEQGALGTGVADDIGGNRGSFGMVGVEQPGRGPAAHGGRQLPAEVGRVLQAQVQALAPGRIVDVRRVAGQEDPAGAVGRRVPGLVAHPA